MKRVEITWIDSQSGPNEWEFLADRTPLIPAVCTTVGFVIEETDEHVLIANSISKTQLWGQIVIPKVSIRSRRSLRYG